MKTKTRTCKHPCCPTTGPCRRIPTPKKARTLIAPYSKKRQKENRIYSALRKQFLINNPNCQALLDGCTGQATDVHHSRGRIGNNYLFTATWVGLCRSCHYEVETKPDMAKQLGLSKSRLTKCQ